MVFSFSVLFSVILCLMVLFYFDLFDEHLIVGIFVFLRGACMVCWKWGSDNDSCYMLWV